MRHPRLASRHAGIARLTVRPDDPQTIVGRKRGSRRPHADKTVAAVRRLIENSVMTYAEIAAKTGVACASICRWTRDGEWKRPVFAPRATDTVPSMRASARLKARTLSRRLQALAERHIREMEESERVDPERLREALELMKLVKLAARPKRRRKPEEKAALASLQTWEQEPPTLLRAMRSAGVESYFASEEALEDFIRSRKPPPEKRRRSRGGRLFGNEYYARLREKE